MCSISFDTVGHAEVYDSNDSKDRVDNSTCCYSFFPFPSHHTTDNLNILLCSALSIAFSRLK